MNSYTMKMLTGTLFFSGFFLVVSLLVLFCVPSINQDESAPIVAAGESVGSSALVAVGAESAEILKFDELTLKNDTKAVADNNAFFASMIASGVKKTTSDSSEKSQKAKKHEKNGIPFSTLHTGILPLEEEKPELYSKSDADAYSPVEDRGLNLYRQAQTRPIVEWFYTRWTGNRDIALAILENADRNNISVSLAFSLAYVESNFRPRAINYNTNSTIDRGLFQLNSASFPRLSEKDFFNPVVSARYGVSYLRYCIDMGGNEKTGLAIYNAGLARVKSNRTPAKTVKYVEKISRYRARLENAFTSDVVALVGDGTNGLLALNAKESLSEKVYEF